MKTLLTALWIVAATTATATTTTTTTVIQPDGKIVVCITGKSIVTCF